MAAGTPSAYFHARPELRASRPGHEAARDRSGRPAPAPFWTVPHGPSTDRPREMESGYTRPSPSYVGDGCRMQQYRHDVGAGAASPSSVLQPQPPQRTEVRSVGGRLHATAAAVAVAPFPGPAGHALQVHRFPDAAVRESRLGPNLFCVRSDSRGNPQSLGNADASSHDISATSALGSVPADQTWDRMVRTAYALRAPPVLPPQIRSWAPSERTRVQFSRLTAHDDGTTSVEPASLRNADDDDTACTLRCQWTDERGTCNMDVLGDRVWMSHHLSRHHNVVGYEKTPRACLWRGCTDTMNKGSLARHVVSRHLRAGASCGFCSKVYSRADVAKRHTKKCKVANEERGQRDQAEG